MHVHQAGGPSSLGVWFTCQAITRSIQTISFSHPSLGATFQTTITNLPEKQNPKMVEESAERRRCAHSEVLEQTPIRSMIAELPIHAHTFCPSLFPSRQVNLIESRWRSPGLERIKHSSNATFWPQQHSLVSLLPFSLIGSDRKLLARFSQFSLTSTAKIGTSLPSLPKKKLRSSPRLESRPPSAPRSPSSHQVPFSSVLTRVARAEKERVCRSNGLASPGGELGGTLWRASVAANFRRHWRLGRGRERNLWCSCGGE